MKTPAALAAFALLSLSLLTCVLRDQATADAYRLAQARQEIARFESRLVWLEVGLNRRLSVLDDEHLTTIESLQNGEQP